MRIDHIADRDAFLVEDLILTVTNFRGLLGWIMDETTPEEMRRLGIARLDRQLALLAGQADALRRLGDAVVPAGAGAMAADAVAADAVAADGQDAAGPGPAQPIACDGGEEPDLGPNVATATDEADGDTAELAAMIDVLDTWLSERQGASPAGPDACAGDVSPPVDKLAADSAPSPDVSPDVSPGTTPAGPGLAYWLQELSDDETPVLESDTAENPLGAMIFRTRRTDLEP